MQRDDLGVAVRDVLCQFNILDGRRDTAFATVSCRQRDQDLFDVRTGPSHRTNEHISNAQHVVLRCTAAVPPRPRDDNLIVSG
eukprot:801651-Amphidinium_carterae.1